MQSVRWPALVAGAGAGVAGRVPAAAGQGVHRAVGDAGRHRADLDALLPRHPPRQLLAVAVQLLAGARQRRAVRARASLPAPRAARGCGLACHGPRHAAAPTQIFTLESTPFGFDKLNTNRIDSIYFELESQSCLKIIV